ncbi:MAG: hypothetical protein JXB49_29670 [Bacteroidales bacterium]|nr:hypothetical protein [Bacteroidales bacterium]
MTSSDKNRQVIHLQIIATDEHFYYGSITAMFEHFSREQLGVAHQTLYNTWKDEPYVTELAVIRKGRLVQKKQQSLKSKNSNG